MKYAVLISTLFLSALLHSSAAPDTKWYVDPAKALAGEPDFALQGEYSSAGYAAQVLGLGGGKFETRLFTGGLPGAGWDGAEPVLLKGDRSDKSVSLAAEGISGLVKDGILTLTGWGKEPMKKAERQSPTMGKKPPEGANVLFDGKMHRMKGHVEGDLLKAGATTLDEFTAFHLHLEFRIPYVPSAKPGSQNRGNSGVYTFNRYETQILDSFGLMPEYNYCAALYRFKKPDVNMCFPPLTWQTYDIDFTPPVFADEKKTKNARITVRHNGVLVQDNVELLKGTGAGGSRPEIAQGILILQDHANPVRFQNIWIQKK